MATKQPSLFDLGTDRPADRADALSLAEIRWLAAHGALGIVREDEVEEMNGGVRAAYDLLSDGKWRTRAWIEANHPALEAMRRVRDVRALLEVHGWTVERRRVASGARVFEYRIARLNK